LRTAVDFRPGVGLRQSERAQNRLFDERGQPLALLLLGAGVEQRPGPEAVDDDRRAHPGAAPAELLGDERAVEQAELRSPVLGRDVDVHQPDLVRLGDHVGGVRHLVVVLGRPRPDLLRGELVRELAQRLLLLAERKREPARDPLVDRGHAQSFVD
jgi:hypothetical protein